MKRLVLFLQCPFTQYITAYIHNTKYCDTEANIQKITQNNKRKLANKLQTIYPKLINATKSTQQSYNRIG